MHAARSQVWHNIWHALVQVAEVQIIVLVAILKKGFRSCSEIDPGQLPIVSKSAQLLLDLANLVPAPSRNVMTGAERASPE